MGAMDFDWIEHFLVSEGPTERYPDTFTWFPERTNKSKTGHLETEHQKRESIGFIARMEKAAGSKQPLGVSSCKRIFHLLGQFDQKHTLLPWKRSLKWAISQLFQENGQKAQNLRMEILRAGISCCDPREKQARLSGSEPTQFRS